MNKKKNFCLGNMMMAEIILEWTKERNKSVLMVALLNVNRIADWKSLDGISVLLLLMGAETLV